MDEIIGRFEKEKLWLDGKYRGVRFVAPNSGDLKSVQLPVVKRTSPAAEGALRK